MLHILCPLVWKLPIVELDEMQMPIDISSGLIQMDSKHQSQYSQIQPVDYISDLNDHCLLHIFENLSTFQLIAVAQLSDRFFAICMRMIQKRPSTYYTAKLVEERIIDFELIKKSNRNNKLTLSETEAILKCVQGFVTTIYMTGSSFEVYMEGENKCKTLKLDCILNILNKYSKNLEHLHLSNFYIVKNMSNYKNIWKNLKSLHLSNYSMEETEIGEILLQAKQLHTFELEILYIPKLTIDYVENFEPQLLSGTCLFKLSKTVKSLTLRNCKGLKLFNLIKVFEINSQLEQFSYSSYHKDAIGMIIFGEVSKRLRNLTSLRLGRTGSNENVNIFKKIIIFQNLSTLANFKYMTSLLFDANGFNISNLLIKLAEKNILKELTIRNASVRTSKTDIPLFTSLNVFNLFFKNHEEITNNFFVTLSQSLHAPNIEEFDIEFVDSDFRYLYLSQFINGINTFLSPCMSLRKLLFKIPNLKINVKNYLQLVQIRQRTKYPYPLYIYMLRENMSLELSQYLHTNGNAYKHLIDFKVFYARSEYFF